MVDRFTRRSVSLVVGALLALPAILFALPVASASAASCPVTTVGGFEIAGYIQQQCSGDIAWSSSSVVGTQPVVADPIGNADTSVYCCGSKLDTPSGWQINGTAGQGGKDDVGYVFEYSQVKNNQDLAYFGFERRTADGTTYFGIEMNQKPNAPNSHGLSVPDRSDGDILIVLTQQGKGTFGLSSTVYKYASGAYQPCNNCNPPGIITGAVNHSAINPISSSDPIAAANGGKIPANQFAEVAFNLSGLPAGNGTCASPAYNELNTYSIASDSTSAQMKDYIDGIGAKVPSTCAELKILKVGPSGTPAGGATFSISPDPSVGSNASTLTVTDGGTNDPDGSANGVIDFPQVKPGISYTITETAAPPGYQLPGTTSQTQTAPASVTTTFTFTDPEIPSTLKVAKTDAATTVPLDGASFTLYREVTVGKEDPTHDTNAGSCTTTGTSGTCAISGLGFGTYYWDETAAPTGYPLPADTLSPATTINAGNAGSTLPVTTVADAKTLSALSVDKTDASTHAGLAGGVFTLYREASSGTEAPASDAVAGKCTTGSNGTCTVSGLGFGTYYWDETAAPVGYHLPSNPDSAPITIDASNAGTTLPVTTVTDVKATAPTGGLTVTKSVHTPTGGISAGFGDRLVYTLTTTAHGSLAVQHHVVITDVVPAGTAYVAGSADCTGAVTKPCTVTDPTAANHQTIVWELGDLGTGSSRSVSFAVDILRPTPRANGAIPAEVIDNIGAVGSTETARNPSNRVKTPVVAVLPLHITKHPTVHPAPKPAPNAVLPMTGFPLWLGTWIGALLVAAGSALLSVSRRRARN